MKNANFFVSLAMLAIIGCGPGGLDREAVFHPYSAAAPEVVRVASGQRYELATLKEDATVYIDRGYVFTVVPSSLAGRTFIKTANDDKYASDERFLELRVDQPVTLFVLYDVRATKRPTWLADWRDTGDVVGSTDFDRRVFSKTFAAGTIVLGGNHTGGDTGAGSNYSVVVGSESALEVTIEGVASDEPYRLARFTAGEPIYIDRGYTFSKVPASLSGQLYVRTANDDKRATQASFLTLGANAPVDVFVLYDARASKRPSWLADWEDTGALVETTDYGSSRKVFVRSLPAGSIVLGGNHTGGDTGAWSNYSVVIASQGSTPRPEPSLDTSTTPPDKVVEPPTSSWHPVRVRRDAAGWPHFFEVYDKKSSKYVSRVLLGYGSIAISGDNMAATLDRFAANGTNFLRLWIEASYGYYAYAYDGKSKVDLDSWNDAFFRRLDDILGMAEARGIVVEVMMWDRCIGWRGGGLPSPSDWERTSQNVHHPDNHFRSSAGGAPIPGLFSGDESRIWNKQWYDTSNSTWLKYQKRYMDRVMVEVRKHDNVAVEIVNEAPDTSYATGWRKALHRWFRSKYPDILVSSEALGGLNGADDAMRQWGRDNLGLIDIVSTHDIWSYDTAQDKYWKYRGVLPGCNEEYENRDKFADLAFTRRFMWGLVMGGGATWIENADNYGNGAKVTAELHAFFNPSEDQPAFWQMRPHKTYVVANAGHHYVLAKDDKSEILVFVDDVAGTRPFSIDASGRYRARWFSADGRSSTWTTWQEGESWTFTPPRKMVGLQLRRIN